MILLCELCGKLCVPCVKINRKVCKVCRKSRKVILETIEKLFSENISGRIVNDQNNFKNIMLDINCDLAEGMSDDELIMPYITSANIACGFHAGSSDMMKRTVDLCIKHKVKIGAHPSFLDRENFGRTEMQMPDDVLMGWITEQITSLQKICADAGTVLHHVKPHGALYNMSARDAHLAKLIAETIKKIDANLVLYGLCGSVSITEAAKIGLQTAHEVFSDRTYQNNGTLTPRSQKNALIEDVDIAVQQLLQIVREKKVTTVSGEEIPMSAQTVCIHGDGKHALLFAKKFFETLNT